MNMNNMNQNNMQGYRQNTYQQQYQNRQLTQEELQRTQVLNLQDVKAVARYERRTSKKPALIVAIIGILLLTVGTTFQVSSSLKAARENNKVEKRKKALAEKQETSIKCSKVSADNGDGTSSNYIIVYNFDEDGLVGFTKTLTLNTIDPTNPATASIENFYNNYAQYLNQVEGYKVEAIINDTKTQFVSSVTADLTKINMLSFPEIQQIQYSTKIDYALTTSQDKIKDDMIANSYTCE